MVKRQQDTAAVKLVIALSLLGIYLPTHAIAQPQQPTQPTQPNKPEQTNKPARNNPDQFPPNPLEIKTPDPLLPNPNRPLTAAEREQLITTLDGLNAQALEKLKVGDRESAFDIWNRELRLRRSLGLVPEIQALGRVGDVAWRENITTQVRWITARLDEIQKQTNPPADNTKNSLASADAANRIAILDALGAAYQQVRQFQAVVEVYQQILTDARQRQDAVKVQSTLLTLAQVNLIWFNYPNATTAYQELLATAKTAGNIQNQLTYLNELAYVQEQAKQPKQAIVYQEQLIALYQQQNLLQPIPALRIKLADNYQQLSQPDQAEKNYQLAYQEAQPLFQFGYASDALQKLGELYRKNDRLDAAIRVYDYLIGVEQQAYNTYGVMETYDKLGQIYRAQKAYPQALNAFQKGLNLARQLKYRTEYFTTQIQQVAKESGQ